MFSNKSKWIRSQKKKNKKQKPFCYSGQKKKKMCRAYKNWYDVFPGSGRGVYLKKKKKQTKRNKGQKDRRVNNIISRFIKYW